MWQHWEICSLAGKTQLTLPPNRTTLSCVNIVEKNLYCKMKELLRFAHIEGYTDVAFSDDGKFVTRLLTAGNFSERNFVLPCWMERGTGTSEVQWVEKVVSAEMFAFANQEHHHVWLRWRLQSLEWFRRWRPSVCSSGGWSYMHRFQGTDCEIDGTWVRL